MKVSNGIFHSLLAYGKAYGRKYDYKLDGVYIKGFNQIGVFRKDKRLGEWELIGVLSF